jgi:hypothetical protein
MWVQVPLASPLSLKEVTKVATSKKKWVQKAIGNPGALRAKTKTPEGKNIPVETLNRLAKQPGTTGRQARLALTMRKWHK